MKKAKASAVRPVNVVFWQCGRGHHHRTEAIAKRCADTQRVTMHTAPKGYMTSEQAASLMWDAGLSISRAQLNAGFRAGVVRGYRHGESDKGRVFFIRGDIVSLIKRRIGSDEIKQLIEQAKRLKEWRDDAG